MVNHLVDNYISRIKFRFIKAIKYKSENLILYINLVLKSGTQDNLVIISINKKNVPKTKLWYIYIYNFLVKKLILGTKKILLN